MSAGVEIKRIDTGGKQKQGVKLRKFMLAGKSLLTLANNIKVLSCNRSGEPRQCATVSSRYQTNERKFWFALTGKF